MAEKQKMIEEEISSLIRKKAGLKLNLIRFTTFFNNVKTSDIDISNVLELEMRVGTIESNLLQEYLALDLELFHLDSTNYDSSDSVTFENQYYSIVSEAKHFIAFKQAEASINVSRTDQTLYNGAQIVPSHSHGVSLPRIQLPKFSGVHERWLEFKDLFVSLIHHNNSISAVEKFYYLRTYLEGSAAQCIKSLDTSEQNYQIAWDILCNRFDNKKLLVYKYIKSLLNIHEIKPNSPKALRYVVDTLSENLNCLKNSGVNTNSWDPLIIYHVTCKLDSETLREWEMADSDDDLATLEQFSNFLSNRADFLEKYLQKAKPSLQNSQIPYRHAPGQGQKRFSGVVNEIQKSKFACYYCQNHHNIYKCPKFLSLTVPQRKQKVIDLNLCFNCLQHNHSVDVCKYGNCRHCHEKHNSLLHANDSSVISAPSISSLGSSSEPISSIDTKALTTFCNYAVKSQVLLATALVKISDAQGNKHVCRALLDNGSMSNFVSQNFIDKLGIPQNRIELSVKGIGNCESSLKTSCDVNISSLNADFNTFLHCLVIPEITDILPISFLNPKSIQVPERVQLADPEFYKPCRVDLLIGADTFWSLMHNEMISIGKNMPILQNTRLGWIISGPIGPIRSKVTSCHFVKTSSVQDQLVKFWEIEEVSHNTSFSNEEMLAEKHFGDTFSRNQEGRFIVSVPLKESINQLGDSKELARKQFFSLERKLLLNPTLKKMYVDFMKEYIDLNHMSSFHQSESQITYFSPHHGVLREDHDTTKLRVVFNSSAISTSGYSYNNLQMVGPVVQEDLFSILLRFRQHLYAFTADICKMYRQILVKDEFKPLQLILWRESPDNELQTFSLNTVTYGTSSAPFLATRCIKQLAIETKFSFPQASEVISRDFYIDDVLSGGNSISSTIDICNQISEILSSANFELRKWKSNSKDVLDGIKISNSSTDTFYFSTSENGKTLGLIWSPSADCFSFYIDLSPISQKITKRLILSEIAKIFDPLGLLGPIIIVPKLTLQSLWLLKLSWDHEVPDSIAQKWLSFRTQLSTINTLKIPRCVSAQNAQSIEIHGFSDASEKAYGACIYVRVIDFNHHVHLNLITSKSRVAPLKSISIPRLELCAAVLLAKLFEKVNNSISLKIKKYFLWSDSTVVLSWIRTSPHLLQSFVGNRVTEIQNTTNIQSWRYVPTELNPADSLSRGMSPIVFIHFTTWFSGPTWLRNSQNEWPHDISLSKPILHEELPELRNQSKTFVQVNSSKWFPFERFSSLNRLKRVMAYSLRFINNLRNSKSPKSGFLTIVELRDSLNVLVKLSQHESFPLDMCELTKSGVVSNKSRLLSLTPFLENGIIRVGGRLKHSSYSFNKRHPVVLSSDHILTKLILKHEHLQLLHCGPNQLLAHVREFCWPISGKNLAKRIIRECVTCFRFKPKALLPIMGNLPEQRVNPRLPFADTGIDYAGPFSIKDRKGRGCKVQKCYLCLFVCLATKSIHLELVSELSTPAFLETFQRFIARRGKPAHVYSDNGSNFVGANNQLKELSTFLKSSESSLSDKIDTTFNIQWHFIPAYSPHQGGLWEAGIKSAKHHIKRVLSNTLLTFEGFYTVITQIESILNSRPLTPLSTDPNDLEVLTPAHFLIGRSLQTIPFPDVMTMPVNRLSNLEQLERLKQSFWSRWSKEYISQLQQRTKWKTNKCQIQVGSLVLIREDNLPPYRWKLGRIVTLHPGSDMVVRVVSIKTSNGVIKRAVVKVCPLPLAEAS